MPKLTEYAADAATIAGSVETLFSLYEQLEPGAKSLLEAEAKKAIAEFDTIKVAVANFKSASVFGKVSAGISLLSSVLDVGSFVQSLYTDGQQYFGTSWPQVQAEIATIKGVLAGVKPAPMIATQTAPVVPAALAPAVG